MDSLPIFVKCECICHGRGLNPWIVRCPRCLCMNEAFDERIDPPFEYGNPLTEPIWPGNK